MVRKIVIRAGWALAALMAWAGAPASAELLEAPIQVSRWGTGEVTLSSSRPYQNPFRDVQLSAEFRAPSGKIFRPEGFHDGGRLWKLRIMPDEPGEWSFRTLSNDPELSGHAGRFTVNAAQRDEHGPVRVSAKYHFAHADGTPFFVLGTTQYGGLIGGATERARMIGRLQQTAFNKARFMLLGGSWINNPVKPFADATGGRSDYLRPNPAYYREVEEGLRQLQALGVQADLILFNPYLEGQGPGNMSNMEQDADAAYLRYAVARLSAFSNVWWTMANEYDTYRKPKDWPSLGQSLARADPYGHLASMHHGVFGFYDSRAPWITHVNIQDVTMQRRPDGPRNLGAIALEARAVGKPVVVDEYGYEGNNGFAWGSFSAREVIDMHWSVAMAGAFGSHGESYHGAGDAIEFVGDSPPRLKFLRDVLVGDGFETLAPANDILSYRGILYAPSALARRGSLYLIYVPEPREQRDWNPGFFGPATASRPLPIPTLIDEIMVPSEAEITVQVDPGLYKVEVIDTWQMQVSMVGYTSGPLMSFMPRITPGALRLTRVSKPPADSEAKPLKQLLMNWR